jgi:hypothetical protein
MDASDGRYGIAASGRRQRFSGICLVLFEARRANSNSVSEILVRDYCFQMTLPPTIVAAGPPLNFRPSNGELRDLLGEAFTS